MAKKGLYYNINKRKKAGTSRSKKKSTISAKAYANMKAGFPKSKSKKKKKAQNVVNITAIDMTITYLQDILMVYLPSQLMLIQQKNLNKRIQQQTNLNKYDK